MYFREIAEELKTLMEPAGRGGKFVCTLVGLSLHPPMTDEEDQAQYLHEYNSMEKNISDNRYLKVGINTFQKHAQG